MVSSEYEKLNAKIFKGLNLINYGSILEKKNAVLLPLGSFVMQLFLNKK
jgi:hypothetical protein